jgi:hypothetical protein
LRLEAYTQFAESVLSDLAERRDETGAMLVRGHRREKSVSGVRIRVRLRGDHICYLGWEPFRDSDCSSRLVLAVMAYEEAYKIEHPAARRLKNGSVHGANCWACSKVAAAILSPSGERFRRRFLIARRGPKPLPKRVKPARPIDKSGSILRNEKHSSRLDELDALIAAEPKRKPKDTRELPLDVKHLSRIVRSQVHQFRRTHERECVQQFNSKLNAFRSEWFRDAEWYSETEPTYRSRLAGIDRQGCSFDEAHATAAIELARHLHDQGKFDEAAVYYAKAVERWTCSTPLPEERRRKALSMLNEDLAKCQACLPRS